MKPILPRALILGLFFSLATFTSMGSTRLPNPKFGRTHFKPFPPPSAKPHSKLRRLEVSQTKNLMGMNVDFTGDYSETRMFADAIKQSRTWQKLDSDQPAPIDANGWPLQDVRLTVWHGISRMNGTYSLSFNGRADVGIDCCAGSIQNKTYNASTNTTTANLVYPATNKVGLFLRFQNTQRTASSAIDSGITNVKLMRPTTEGGTQTYPPATLFNPTFKAVLKRFKVLRFMDFLATNSNQQVNWSDRLTPDWYSMAQAAPGYGWQGKGGAYEYAIQLCNEVGADCWLNVPAKADDNYVRQLATLIKSQVSPKRKVYIEYSNELWNTDPPFQQSVHNQALANAEVASGKSALNFDGDTNQVNWAWRRVAKRGAEISTIFRQVFGDAAMMERVRPVLMTQLGYADGPLLQAIHLMQDYYNNPNWVDKPKPLNYYFYGLGGSGYYNPKTPTSPGATLADLTNSAQWTKVLQKDMDYAAAFGVKRIAYEGGPSLEGGNITDANRAGYRDNPQMKAAMVQAHDLWSANGGDLFGYFTITGESPWGFVTDTWDATNAKKNLKLQAIDALNTRARAKATYGIPLPATLEASQSNIPPGWIDDRRTDRLKVGQWFSYTTLAKKSGAFNLRLKAGAEDANGKVEIWVNGNWLGTLTIPSTGSLGTTTDTSNLTMQLNEGIHGLMIRTASGTVNVNQIILSQATATQSKQMKCPPHCKQKHDIKAAPHRGQVRYRKFPQGPSKP
jgi:Carbohydrate binding module (family 6)